MPSARTGATVERLALAAQVKVLRERGGLKWREVSEKMGISRSYAETLYSDPDGSKARARKDSYAGACVDCGAPTSGSDGRAKAPKRCVSCAGVQTHENRRWTRGVIIAHIWMWAAEYGRPPTATDWLMPTGSKWPSVMATQREFGSWSAAVEAAGFERPLIGMYERTPAIRAQMSDSQRKYSDVKLVESLRELAVTLGCVPFVRELPPGHKDAIRQQLGSMTRAYELAGLPPPLRGRNRRQPLPPDFDRNGDG